MISKGAELAGIYRFQKSESSIRGVRDQTTVQQDGPTCFLATVGSRAPSNRRDVFDEDLVYRYRKSAVSGETWLYIQGMVSRDLRCESCRSSNATTYFSIVRRVFLARCLLKLRSPH